MTDIFAIFTDVAVIFFDLLLYSMLFKLKKETIRYRAFMYVGCGVFLLSYFIGVYLYEIPASLGAAIFMSVPSFLLFLALSRHKGSRFILTFSFVDTVTLIIAFIGRYVGILVPGGSVWALIVVVSLFSTLVVLGHRYFRSYHLLLDTVDNGWGTMALSTVLIYFALIFFAAYPIPMIERPEYAPCWLVFATVVLTCYGVFFQSIQKTQHIQEQNERLQQEKELFQMVYTDALTGLFNRAAYIENLNYLERESREQSLCCIMIDCNHFKQINDRFGHHTGDIALQQVSDALKSVFSGHTDYLFRIGGDEFAVILHATSPDEPAKLLAQLNRTLDTCASNLNIPLSVSFGFCFTQPEESLEDTFIRADKQMYQNKHQ